MTYEELLEENKKLKAEIKEAYDALYPAGLVNGKGEEIPTTLIDRAKMAVMIIDSESSFVDEVQKERDELLKKDKHSNFYNLFLIVWFIITFICFVIALASYREKDCSRYSRYSNTLQHDINSQQICEEGK
jgi:hypothetical protein